MNLILVRHGEAAPADQRGDPARPLTEEGRDGVRRMAQLLQAMNLHVDRLLHSPVRRAEETADLLGPVLTGDIFPLPALTEPPGPQLLKALGGRSVLLVGHQPYLGELLAWLVVGDPAAGDRFRLEPGAVAWLVGMPAPGQMRVEALLPPLAAAGSG